MRKQIISRWNSLSWVGLSDIGPTTSVSTRVLIHTTVASGTLSHAAATLTIDTIAFRLDSESHVELDVLSYETNDYKVFRDVNDDCAASFDNTALVLFRTTDNRSGGQSSRRRGIER